jgi:SAM-dependent methyltransferase
MTKDEPAPNALREIFGEDPYLYDRMRPGYPEAVVRDLVELGPVGPDTRVLEIGPGTGQLTRSLAEMGCRIIGVELSAALADVARSALVSFPNVEIVTSAFEDWPLPTEPFDAVVAATAFHWLDPTTRVAKSAGALRRGGVLATIATHHVDDGGSTFFVDVQSCYERWDPDTRPGFRLPAPADVPFDAREIDASPRFGAATFRRYEWDATYSARDYVDLLMTYSNHRAMPPDARDGLLDCVARLIDSRFAGTVRKRYLTELRLARRTD